MTVDRVKLDPRMPTALPSGPIWSGGPGLAWLFIAQVQSPEAKDRLPLHILLSKKELSGLERSPLEDNLDLYHAM